MGNRIEKGINDLASRCPELLAEWNYEKNDAIGIYPDKIAPYSSKKAWWRCSKGHEWQAFIRNRVNGSGCPYCTNKKVLVGYNDLATIKPEILDEWDYGKNKINLMEILAGSGRKVWWKCRVCGYEWQSAVKSRVKGSGCPECAKKRMGITKNNNLIKINGSLESNCHEIASEWNHTKNGDLKPYNVTVGSNKKVWWLGKCGHEWQATVSDRVNKGSKCPYCSNQKLLAGFNDFATTNPEMLSEWDYAKNIIQPSEVFAKSQKMVWWKCPFGHSYQSLLLSRCGSQHTGCPICIKEMQTSFPEQALFFYIKKYYPDAINSDRDTIGMELDIYIPSLRIAVEYDGKTWHKNNKLELKKNETCNDNNIVLIRIREEGLVLYDNCNCIVRTNIDSNESLSEVIRTVLFDIGDISETDVDVDRDSSLIYNSYIIACKSQSLKNTYPEIAKEWHPTKNGEITTDMVAATAHKKFWWLGKCGHEWQAIVNNRTNKNSGCPICDGKKIVGGINDLLSNYPIICYEWYYEKNNEIGLFPDRIAPHSNKKAWWKCHNCGYIWQSVINNRINGSGCPECGKKVNVKPVMCIETETMYASIKEAEDKTGIKSQSIGACCLGKQKTAGGYHWKYCI